MLWISKQKFLNKYLPLILSVVLLVVGLGTYFIIQKSKTTEAAWYSSASGTWNYRQKITIDHTKVNTATSTTTPLTNFPMLISTTNVLFKSMSNGGHVGLSTGNDIVFTSGDGLTKLSHEIEYYASSTGQLISWVKIPSLSSVTDTVIYMYYGNAAETGNEQNVTGVWDGNYKAVYHLPDGSSLSALDSKAVNNGTAAGTTATTSPIGGAAGYLGTPGNTINIGSDASLRVGGSTSATWQFWMNPGQAVNNPSDPTMLSFGSATQGNWSYWIRWQNTWGGGPGRYLKFTTDKAFTQTGVTSTYQFSANAWTHVVITYDSSSASNNFKMYYNGSLVDTFTYASSSFPTNFLGAVGNIGEAPSGGNQTQFAYLGSLDEVRISDAARSADWITAEYNNQNSPSTFMSYSSEETQPTAQVNGGWYNAAWQYRKKIVINHSQVSGTSTLSNFPVLVSISSDPLLSYTSYGGHVASSTGGDILFTNSSGVLLNFEREYYASTTGQLIAWVQVPNLSPTSDTVLYVYYGNASATDLQNRAATWDSNFKGVWHLPNGTSLSVLDSTGLNTSTNNGAGAVSGQIDGAASFDNNITHYIDTGGTTDSTTLTAEAWVYPTFAYTSATFPSIFGELNSAGTTGWLLYYNSTTDKWVFYCARSTVSVVVSSSAITSDTQLGRNTWRHIVGVVSGNSATLYINGVPVGTATGSGSSVAEATNTKIGTSDGFVNSDGPWLGNIDETRISNSARPASWIATEYNNQSSPSTFAFVAGEETQSQTTFNSSWYSSQWGYRKPIVIDRRKVNQATGTTTPLTNFPVLVSLTDTDLKNNASSTGADIFFTSSDGLTKLNYEREYYASSTGQLVAWVSVPSLSNVTDTVLYMYFGNTSATDQQSANATWSSSYGGVWHLPNGTTLTANDSTSGAANGSLSGPPSAIAGQINGGASFNGSSQYVTMGDKLDLGTGDFAISGWIKPGNQDQIGSVISKRAGSSPFTQYNILVGDVSSGGVQSASKRLSLFVYNGGGSPSSVTQTQNYRTVNNVADGNWHFIVCQRSGASVSIYVDGVNQSLTAVVAGSSAINGDNAASLNFGYDSSLYYTGQLDEVRISTTVRTTDWIFTEYQNQSSSSTFYALGGIQRQNRSTNVSGVGASSRSWYNKAWTNRIPVTISKNMVGSSTTASLANFPVLVSLTNASLKSTGNGGGVSSTSGNDILFTDSDGGTKLSHEIESYDPVNGVLVAWVKVPQLSSVNDHILYLYYGNSSAADQSNASGVWDPYYKAIWHLRNGTTLSGANSTGGTALSSTSGTVAATSGQSQMDGAVSLSGTAAAFSSSTFASFGSGQPKITVSGWVNLDATYNCANFGSWFTTGINQPYAQIDGSCRPYFQVYNASAGSANAGTAGAGATMTKGNWYYLVGVYNGSTVKSYLNGVDVSNPTGSLTGNVATLSQVAIGGSNNFVGKVDEVRVSNTDRSTDWILTEYLNQNSPATYVTAGSAQSQQSATTPDNWYNTSWTNRRKISIDKRKISQVSGTTLTNFPMLFSTTDNEFKLTSNGGKVALSSGNDFVFTDSDGKSILSYEIEKYSTSTGQLIAWVKIPNLSPASDYTIYLYFGNASATNQQSTATWDSNFKGVWHLPDGVSLTASDSTSNGVNGAVTGATAGSGQIDGAANFDSSGTNNINLGTTSLIAQSSAKSAFAWIKPAANSTATFGRIFHHDIAGSQWSLSLGANGLSVPNAVGGTPDNNGHYGYSPANSVPRGVWSYVGWTFDGTNFVLYVNGVPQPQNTTDGQYGFNNGNVYIGYRNLANPVVKFNGLIDEVKISNTARSADWVKTEYLNQIDPGSFYSIDASNTQTRSAGVPTMKVRGSGGVKFR